MAAQGAKIASQPLTLDVQPLPAGAPASFQGAVGQYWMEAGVDKTETVVGDAVTSGVTITGTGNIEQVADPAWPDDAAWRAFDSKSTTDSQFQDGQLVGIRRIERVLVPTSRVIGRCRRPSSAISTRLRPVPGRSKRIR